MKFAIAALLGATTAIKVIPPYGNMVGLQGTGCIGGICPPVGLLGTGCIGGVCPPVGLLGTGCIGGVCPPDAIIPMRSELVIGHPCVTTPKVFPTSTLKCKSTEMKNFVVTDLSGKCDYLCQPVGEFGPEMRAEKIQLFSDELIANMDIDERSLMTREGLENCLLKTELLKKKIFNDEILMKRQYKLLSMILFKGAANLSGIDASCIDCGVGKTDIIAYLTKEFEQIQALMITPPVALVGDINETGFGVGDLKLSPMLDTMPFGGLSQMIGGLPATSIVGGGLGKSMMGGEFVGMNKYPMVTKVPIIAKVPVITGVGSVIA